MAKNNLTPEQDLLTREFYEQVALLAEDFMPDHPASARQLRGTILDMLGYRQLPNGARIDKDIEVKGKFGTDLYEGYADEWYEDADKAKAAIEASTSKSTEGTEVRTSVLSEDVQQVEKGRGEDTAGVQRKADRHSNESYRHLYNPKSKDV